jgi:hypothetical protein
MLHLRADELRLGDTVELYEGPWSTAIVERIEGNQVTFFRPYGTTADFSCGDHVITYVGTEKYSVFIHGGNTSTYNVVSRKTLS